MGVKVFLKNFLTMTLRGLCMTKKVQPKRIHAVKSFRLNYRITTQEKKQLNKAMLHSVPNYNITTSHEIVSNNHKNVDKEKNKQLLIKLLATADARSEIDVKTNN